MKTNEAAGSGQRTAFRSLSMIKIIESYSYDAFGKTTIRDADGEILTKSQYGNRFMFTGREYDTETGLYYYRARYYNPEIGRFLQPDPIGYAGGFNLYAYVDNNPINAIDPWGLDAYLTTTWIGPVPHLSLWVDVWENNRIVGRRRYDFSAPHDWRFPLGIFLLRGEITVQDYGIENLRGRRQRLTPSEDALVRRFLDRQAQNPPYYNLGWHNCDHWAYYNYRAIIRMHRRHLREQRIRERQLERDYQRALRDMAEIARLQEELRESEKQCPPSN